MVSRDLGYVSARDVEALISELTEIARMLNSLRTKVVSTK